jgi:hypothetical protein
MSLCHRAPINFRQGLNYSVFVNKIGMTNGPYLRSFYPSTVPLGLITRQNVWRNNNLPGTEQGNNNLLRDWME